MSLRADSKISLRHNVLLSQYTTMQIGGPAQSFAEPASEEELSALLNYARRESIPAVILGKGSNVIFPDDGYPGMVITLLQFEKNRIEFDDSKSEVRVSAGVFLYKFVLACRDHGLGGAEFLANIPGTIGGALVMNAGFSRFSGQKSEIGDIVTEVTVLNSDGTREVLTREQLEFEYRKSNLADRIVIEGKFRLWRRTPSFIEKEIRACFKYRNDKQDLKHPSSGSVFKNPPAPLPPAARLIDELGLKGTRVGGMMVSPKHANYFINVGQGKCAEMSELIQLIQNRVFHVKGIWLEPEVRFIPKP